MSLLADMAVLPRLRSMAVSRVRVRSVVSATRQFASRPTPAAARPTVNLSSTRPPLLVRFATGPARSGNTFVQHQRDKKAAAAAEKIVGSRNNEIPFRHVQIVDEDGKLGEPVSIAAALRELDFKTHALVCVNTKPPICKIVNLEAEKAQEREREARAKIQRRLAVEDKEIQVGWSAAEGDLTHKMAVARGVLEKGDRAQLIFAMRANSSGGARTYMPDSRKVEIVAQFDEALSEVGKRWKDDQIEKGLWICHWAPSDSVAAEVRAKTLEDATEKRKLRDEKKEARRLKEEERVRKAKERAAGKGR